MERLSDQDTFGTWKNVLTWRVSLFHGSTDIVFGDSNGVLLTKMFLFQAGIQGALLSGVCMYHKRVDQMNYALV